MKTGDLIKHKRSDTLGVIARIFKGEKKMLASVLFSDGTKHLCTAPLELLEENWKVIT